MKGLTGPLADTLRRISEQAGKLNTDGKLDPALLKELADLKFALNAVNAEMRRPSVSHLLQQEPIVEDPDAFGSSTALDDLSSNNSNSSSNAWPMGTSSGHPIRLIFTIFFVGFNYNSYF